MTNTIDIKSLTYNEIDDYIQSIGEKKFRTNQIFSWLYNNWISSFEDMKNINKNLIKNLTNNFYISKPSLITYHSSKDGSIKFLLQFKHDKGLINCECVAIKSNNNKYTLCISSQAGCPLKCSFCSTGQSGFKANLSLGNIFDQIKFVENYLDTHVSNIVFMGQGEPFLNYNNVINSLDLINSNKFLNIGARKITISTSGIISGIDKFSLLKKQYGLAVSLHCANQSKRNKLMPGLKNNTLIDLKNSLIKYQKNTHRRITFEYIMIKSINDTEEDLLNLINYCNNLNCYINLIPFNKVDNLNYLPSKKSTINKWIKTLRQNNIKAEERKSKGQDIAAACGQLSNNK